MRKPIAAEALSNLIGSIYDCAVEPDRWPDTLTHLRIELDFAGASLGLVALPLANMLLEIMSAADPAWIAAMPQNRQDVAEMWGGLEKLMSFPVGEPVILSHVRDRALWESSQLYREWGKSAGVHDIMAIGLARDSTMIGSAAFIRHRSAGDVGNFEVDAVLLLIPHLRRAVAISKLLDVKSVVASTFAAALDTLAVAVVLTDDNLRIVHANAVAQVMLSARDPISSEGGRLALRSSAGTEALGVAVRQAAKSEAAIGRRGFGIPAPRNDGAPCVLHVLPLKHGALRPGLAPTAAAAIFVAPVASPPPAPSEALAALFDFTAAEARVFAQIAAGMTPAEAAQALGVETSTVRTHLLRIFAKTGTRRQADLVKLAASMALPLS